MTFKKPSYRLALFAFLIAIVVVVLGAFTRLRDAGLGCPDWPTCYGHLWVPDSAEEIHAANQAFSTTPVETDKTWPEQVHRIFASSLGVLTIGLLIMAIRHRRHPGQPLKLPAFLLTFIILQGLFGMWTVTLLLWPQVVTAHLLGGFTTLSLLWLMVQRLGNFSWKLPAADVQRIRQVRTLAIAGLLIVIVQIMLGGWTSTNYAALACPDFPTCHQTWLPEMDLKDGFNIFQHIGPNYLGGQLDNTARTAIHFVHRLGALATFLTVLVLVGKLLATGVPQARQLGVVTAIILFAQVGLGISNVVFALPLPVAVAHNGVGALLLLAMVTICHRVLTVEQTN